MVKSVALIVPTRFRPNTEKHSAVAESNILYPRHANPANPGEILGTLLWDTDTIMWNSRSNGMHEMKQERGPKTRNFFAAGATRGRKGGWRGIPHDVSSVAPRTTVDRASPHAQSGNGPRREQGKATAQVSSGLRSGWQRATRTVSQQRIRHTRLPPVQVDVRTVPGIYPRQVLWRQPSIRRRDSSTCPRWADFRFAANACKGNES